MLDFHTFTWQDKDTYTPYFQASPVHYAEYSFFSLWAWLHDYPLEVAYTDANICWLRSSGPIHGIFGPVGNWDTITDWDRVLADFDAGTVIYDVPRKLKDILVNREGLRFTEDRDQHEYVYSVKDLIALKGKAYSHKRNRVRAFLDGYEWDYEEITPAVFGEVMDFQEKWRVHREGTMTPDEAASLDGEDIAVRNAFAKWKDFGFMGGLLRVDGRIIAYTIAEELDSENLDVHFEKAFSEYAGSYQAINYMFLKNQGAGYKFVNREEDMGELGLRAAKLSYNPILMLEKYQMEIL
ncbi:MAG: DUF2156 domain-containing protein [Synergistaceae bacterium]|nr:DUF2156 domain-containing protein [Synergistaceae bacterium]